MTATIQRRVAALEESSRGIGGGKDECPECGGPLDGKPGPNDTYELLFIDRDDEDPQNEWCSTCGRQTHIVLEWE